MSRQMTEFEWDVLDDLKLSPGNGYVYAKVTGDSSWSSTEPYNPFLLCILAPSLLLAFNPSQYCDQNSQMIQIRL